MCSINPLVSSIAQKQSYEVPTSFFSSLNQRVCKLAKQAFQTLTLVARFPLRYLGSKTWSIPGILIRAPQILLCKIQKKAYESLFSTPGYQQERHPATKTQIENYLPICAMTVSTHLSNDEKYSAPFGICCVKPNALEMDLNNLPGNIQKNDNCFFDTQTGFKAFVAKDQKTGQIYLSFGAVSASNSEIPFKEKKQQIILRQLADCGKNIIGLTPLLYEQADAFTKEFLKIPLLEGKEPTLTGHCLGASLISYASLRNKVSSVCFNALGIGPGLQEKVGKQTLKDAEKYITHLSTYGDYTSDSSLLSPLDSFLNTLGIKTIGNFGKRFYMESPYKGLQNRHVYIFGAMMHHLGFDKKDVPNQLNPAQLTFSSKQTG